MNSNYQGGEGRNRLLLILCILLFILFGVLLLWSRRSNAAEADRLRELAAQEEQKDQTGTRAEQEETQTEETAGEETEENGDQQSRNCRQQRMRSLKQKKPLLWPRGSSAGEMI